VQRILTRLLEIRSHHLGPRVYVAGVRVHECWAGLAATAILIAASATDHIHHRRLDGMVGIVAVWMMAKDWPDFFPSRRDTYSWRVGLHRRGGADEPVPVHSVSRHDV
jgi:hypothetical protein